MKRRSLAFLMIALLAMTVLSGCAGTKIKHLSGSEFITQAKRCSELNSFYWTSYVGASHQRAYLEYAHPAFIGSGLRVIVYWTGLAELPAQLAEQLKAEKPPWRSARKELERRRRTTPGR